MKVEAYNFRVLYFDLIQDLCYSNKKLKTYANVRADSGFALALGCGGRPFLSKASMFQWVPAKSDLEFNYLFF